MSGFIMGQVWNLDLPQSEKMILLAMADHSDHQGNNVFPSVPLIAWKTDYSERHVRRVIKKLRGIGLLVPQKERPGKATIYRIDIAAGEQKKPIGFTPDIDDSQTPDASVTPDTIESPLPLTSDAQTPDIAVSPITNNRHKKRQTADAATKTTTPDINEVKPKADFDWQDMTKAVGEVFNAYGGKANNIIHLLRGTSKNGKWSDHNLEKPASPKEVRKFGAWYNDKFPTQQMVCTAENIQSYFLQYRTEKKKPSETHAQFFTDWSLLDKYETGVKAS